MPPQRTHRKVVVIPAVIHLQLPAEILKGIEGVSSIETFIIFPVASFYFSIMPGGERTDQFVADSKLFQADLENSGLIRSSIRRKALGKFLSVVRLNTFDRAGKSLYQMLKKEHGGIRAMLFKSLYKAPARELINGGVLIEMLSLSFIYETGRRDKFHVDLNPLTRMVHLFVRFRNIFGIRRLNSHYALLAQEAIETGNRSGIASLSELNPEDDEPGIGITLTHISNKGDLLRSMLIGMVKRSSGTITKRIPGAIVAAHPAINVLSVCFVSDSSFGDTMFLSEADQG